MRKGWSCRSASSSGKLDVVHSRQLGIYFYLYILTPVNTRNYLVLRTLLVLGVPHCTSTLTLGSDIPLKNALTLKKMSRYLHVMGVLVDCGKNGLVLRPILPSVPGLEERPPAEVHEGGDAPLGRSSQICP
jgi:hypothetical protein